MTVSQFLNSGPEGKILCSPQLQVAVFATILLSLADGTLTLRLIQNGAQELNPILDFYLKLGPGFFIGFKYLFTSAGVLFLVKHHQCKFFGGRLDAKRFLFLTPLFYLAVVVYQCALVF